MIVDVIFASKSNVDFLSAIKQIKSNFVLPNMDSVTKLQFAAFVFVCALFICAFIAKFLLPLIKSFFVEKEKAYLRKKSFMGGARSTLYAGWIVYMIGFYDIKVDTGTADSFVAFLIRPLISSAEMFVFHSDLLEVSVDCKNNAVFMTAFTIVFAIAIGISSVVVVNCLFNRLFFNLKQRLLWRKFDETNVFFGLNDRSLSLAKDMRANGVRGKMIFVNLVEDQKEIEGHNSLSKILGLRTFHSDKVAVVRKVSGVVINASSSLANDVTMDGRVDSPYALESNGLTGLGRLLSRSKSIRLFFLGDDDNVNVRSSINVVHSHYLTGKEDVVIYCNAPHNSENNTIVDCAQKFEYHLVDDAALSIDNLKMMLDADIPIAHPINYVKVNSAIATVESEFTCLLLGFGRTGQDALRFFYEYGAFVGKDSEKAPFFCKVIDKDMDCLLGGVASNMPAVALDDVEDESGKPIKTKEICFKQQVVGSKEFWRDMADKQCGEHKSFIQKVNCIVVALGSDEENISIATELYEFAVRHNAIDNENGEKLKIFIRQYDTEFGQRLSTVERYYGQENNVIKLFGKMEDMYSYDCIICNKLTNMAKRFYAAYAKATKDVTTWDTRHLGLKSASKDKRIEIRYKESQDRSNSLHQYTKCKLLGLSSPSIPMQFLPSEYPFISDTLLANIMNGEYEFADESEKEKLLWYVRLQNVSHCEHLRWNAAYYMAGFIRNGDEKNFRRKVHRCLVGWNEKDENGKHLLSDLYKLYDYKTVETTIALFCENDEKQY